MWKCPSSTYMVLGFKHTTLRTWVPSITTGPGVPVLNIGPVDSLNAAIRELHSRGNFGIWICELGTYKNVHPDLSTYFNRRSKLIYLLFTYSSLSKYTTFVFFFVFFLPHLLPAYIKLHKSIRMVKIVVFPKIVFLQVFSLIFAKRPA